MRVLVNAATRAELDAGLAAGAEGVGLLRTELAFLEAGDVADRGRAPRARSRPCSSGARRPHRDRARARLRRRQDAALPRAAPHERGLELLLAHPDALDAQLRAIVDAGRDTELRILLPMVETAEQVARGPGARCPAGRQRSAR